MKTHLTVVVKTTTRKSVMEHTRKTIPKTDRDSRKGDDHPKKPSATRALSLSLHVQRGLAPQDGRIVKKRYKLVVMLLENYDTVKFTAKVDSVKVGPLPFLPLEGMIALNGPDSEPSLN
jgi:hypothetical protein